MTRSKEPIAQTAAGGAIDRDDAASQLDLFLPPLTSADGDVATARATACRSDRQDAPELNGKTSRVPSRGVMRPLPVYSDFAGDVPVTAEEIHKVLAALGADFAAIFEKDG